MSFHLFGFDWSCVVVVPDVPGFANSFVYLLPSLPVNLNVTLVGRCPNLLLSSSQILLTGIFTKNSVVVVEVAVVSSNSFSGVFVFIFLVTVFFIFVVP